MSNKTISLSMEASSYALTILQRSSMEQRYENEFGMSEKVNHKQLLSNYNYFKNTWGFHIAIRRHPS